MEEVNKTSAVYLPLAQAAARVYFTLQSMQALHFLYHYDLHFFESVFHDTLHDKTKHSNLKQDDYSGRLRVLFELFFRHIYLRCAMGLLYEDRLVLALQLARIRYESEFHWKLGRTRKRRTRLLNAVFMGQTASGYSCSSVVGCYVSFTVRWI